ncbi:MAG: hypothetical protein JW682_01355 [Campylobacterales bacterium]|nr:hypothetical protein [Campylobacterales bacterium]
MSLQYFKSICLVFLIWGSSLYADVIDIAIPQHNSLLPQTKIYLDDKALSLETLISQKCFQPYNKPYINIGASKKTVWLSLELTNKSQMPVRKVLVLSSALLEDIALYNGNNLNQPIYKGVSHISEKHITMYPFFEIELPPQSTYQYYLEIKSNYNPVDFGLWLVQKEHYRIQDRSHQLINLFLIGMVTALMLYSLMLSFYTNDKSYFYYSVYLLMLIYQQMTYLGLTQIYFPVWFIQLDIHLTVIKIGLLIITAALYSIHFLKITQMPFLYRGYKMIIMIALIQMTLLYLPGLYNLNIVIVTGTFFILYNLGAGIYSYHKGNKQARLFILGFGIVFVSYLFIILNALGVTSIMQDFQNILMLGTVFEAFVLSLAFTDRYTILQSEKEKSDLRFLNEFQNRTKIIENEVIKKTAQLNNALASKKLLLKEMQHRAKNNLQIILSIIRLEEDESEDKKTSEKLLTIEHKINAIAKTYDLLLITDNMEEIDMKEYIESLLEDVENAYNHHGDAIEIQTDIHAKMPLKESSYVGLIINELVTNSYKYAFKAEGIIKVSLFQKNNHFLLTVEDNGTGFKRQKKESSSFGLRLIHALVYEQLGGVMEKFTNTHTKYIIRFTL